MRVMPDANEHVEWAGKTRGEMVEDILENEKKTGKDKSSMSFTKVFNMIMKWELESKIEDLKRPSLAEIIKSNKPVKFKRYSKLKPTKETSQ